MNCTPNEQLLAHLIVLYQLSFSFSISCMTCLTYKEQVAHAEITEVIFPITHTYTLKRNHIYKFISMLSYKKMYCKPSFHAELTPRWFLA